MLKLKNDYPHMMSWTVCTIASTFIFAISLSWLPLQALADQAYDIRECLSGSDEEDIHVVSRNQIEECSRNAIKFCLGENNYQICIEKLRDSLFAIGEEREKKIMEISDSYHDNYDRMGILRLSRDSLKDCAELSGESRAQCEAIVAIAYNVAISSQHIRK